MRTPRPALGPLRLCLACRVRVGAAGPPLMRRPAPPRLLALGHLCAAYRGSAGARWARLSVPCRRFSAGSLGGRPCFVSGAGLGQRVPSPGPPRLLCGAGLPPRGPLARQAALFFVGPRGFFCARRPAAACCLRRGFLRRGLFLGRCGGGRGFLPCLPPAPAAPSGVSRGARGCALGLPALFSSRPLTFPNECAIFFLRGCAAPVGGRLSQSVRGVAKTSVRKDGRFLFAFFRLLRCYRRSDRTAVNPEPVDRQAFSQRVYNPEIVNLILFFRCRGGLSGSLPRPTQQNLCHFVAFVGAFY